MAQVIMITGTNGTGETTLAKELIKRFGGIKATLADRTVCNDERFVFLGRYADDIKHGGCDGLNETKHLATIAADAFSKGAQVVFGEGSYLNTFGINLSNFLFAGDKQLVVFLAAPFDEINKRLEIRSGTGIKDTVAKKKKQLMARNAAKKWHEIGVPTKGFDTSQNTTAEIADFIISRLWCGDK